MRPRACHSRMQCAWNPSSHATLALSTRQKLHARRRLAHDRRMTPRHPSIYLGAKPGPSRRSLDQLRDTIASAYGARLWETVEQGARESVGNDPLLPGTALPGRPVEQIRHANADNTICQAVVRRLLRAALVFLITGEERYRQDALIQMEALFDPQRWPQWLDFAHEMFEADLRTGQLGAGVALTYDWLYAHLSPSERVMIVEGLDRCAIRPYLTTAKTDPHWLTRPSNWMTVVVGGLGIVGMVLGSDHDRTDLLAEMAQPRMEHYLTVLGPNGEFNESVGYASSMHYPVKYFAARHSMSEGREHRLAGHPFPQTCRWLMHMTVAPGHPIPFGDSHPQAPLHIGYFAPIAAATRDGVLQWFLETYGLVHDPATDLSHVDVLDLLWYDPTVAATPPGEDAQGRANLPLGAVFPGWGGLVSSRSSWTDPDAVVVHGKAGREPIHEHQDDGQLIIHAGGAPLIVDLGSPSSYPADFFGENRARYYNASVRGHNLLQIGGREMRFEKPREGTFLHTAFDERGAAWSIDLTGAYRDVLRVRRHVIHLLPDLVAVLDECDLARAEPVVLRWHTADRAPIDASGSFRVQATGPNGPVGLLGQICALSVSTATFRRDEHRYDPPYDRTRLDEPLEQLRESFVAAETNASRCRLLTLFVIAGPGTTTPAWPPERDGDTWQVPVAGGIAAVSVDAEALTASAAGRTVQIPLTA